MFERELEGQVAIVTGAGGMLGAAFAREIASRGGAVLLNDCGAAPADASRPDPLERLAGDLRDRGRQVAINRDPVGTAAHAGAIVAAAVAAFGRIDVLVNNAGLAAPGPLASIDDETTESVYRTNLIGPHFLMKAVWPEMKARGSGRIVNVSSNAIFGLGFNVAYAASKTGILGLTRSAALEGARYGIAVNAVLPVAYTGMTEMIRDQALVAWYREHFQAEKVASVCAPLFAPSCSANGTYLVTGGGRTCRLHNAEGEDTLFEGDGEALRAFLEREDTGGSLTIIDTQPEAADRFRRYFP